LDRRTERLSSDWEDWFDHLVTQILGIDKHGSRQLVLASCHAGAGTSTVARGLAVALARRLSGKVLLVDANLRTPSLHAALGVPRELGLVEAVNLEVPVEDSVLWSDLYPNLRFMTAGRRVARPVQFFESAETEGFLKLLGGAFDYVVLDSAPVGACPETTVLASWVGKLALVLEAEATRWAAAERAKERLEAAGVAVVGAVLNRRRHHIPSWLYQLV
jgi:capsular exopolysaccharide synthesis family protein